MVQCWNHQTPDGMLHAPKFLWNPKSKVLNGSGSVIWHLALAPVFWFVARFSTVLSTYFGTHIEDFEASLRELSVANEKLRLEMRNDKINDTRHTTS